MPRIIVCIVFACCIAGWSSQSCAETDLGLFDLSGSLADARPLLACNFAIFDNEIDSFGKADRVIVLGFRSKGAPWRMADKQFSSQWGPGKSYIHADRSELRSELRHSLRNPSAKLMKMGGSTDLCGSINLAIIYLSDQADTQAPVRLQIFSDGLHSTNGVGSILHLKKVEPYTRRIVKANDYLAALEKLLAESHLAQPVRLDQILWYGRLNDEDLGLLATDLALFSSKLREIWVRFLQRELKGCHVVYKLNYSVPQRQQS